MNVNYTLICMCVHTKINWETISKTRISRNNTEIRETEEKKLFMNSKQRSRGKKNPTIYEFKAEKEWEKDILFMHSNER